MNVIRNDSKRMNIPNVRGDVINIMDIDVDIISRDKI